MIFATIVCHPARHAHNGVKTQERLVTRGAQATMADGPDVGVGHDACQDGYFRWNWDSCDRMTGLDADRRGFWQLGASNVISVTSF